MQPVSEKPTVAAPAGGMPALVQWAALLLITLFLLAADQAYAWSNKRPPTFDDAWYLETSLYFFHQLAQGGFSAFASAYAHSFRIKAPLISVLPLPFYFLLGPGYRPAMLVNTVFLVLSSICLFLLGRRLFSPQAGLAAVIFYQTMPLSYGLSRVFMVDYGLSALVIVWLYCLAVSERLTRGSVNFLLGIVLGLGLLMKVTFPAFIAGPLLVTLLAKRRQPATPASESFWLWRWCAERPLAAIALPGMAVAATWYAWNLSSVLEYAWQGAYGRIGAAYGAGGLSRWLLAAVNQGMSVYYTVALLIAVLAARRSAARSGPWTRGTIFVLAWLIPPFLCCLVSSNREVRLALPLLPAAALLLSAAIFAGAGRPAIRAALAASAAAAPVLLYAGMSFPAAARRLPTGQVGPFFLLSRDLVWAHAPDSKGDWGQQRVLDKIAELGRPNAGKRYVVIGVEHSYFNANLLSYLNAYSQYPFYFTSLGYAEASVNAAVERLYSLNARFLIMTAGFPPAELPPLFNRVNAGVQRQLDQGMAPFHARARIQLSPPVEAVIYQAAEPWQRFAPGSNEPAPQHRTAADFSGGLRFLGFDFRSRGHYLQEITYYWAALRRIQVDKQVHVQFRRGEHQVLLQEFFVTSGEYPPTRWQPGETVRQTFFIYAPRSGDADPLEASLWLTPAAGGAPVSIVAPEEWKKRSEVPLRIEEP
ncbi:MAG TPA: glycosyltransferase family 39 protein [Bryobacterales bacterium]|nr:glycosyltransferase family 39 protein [Bryobacterales bacterium]